MEENIKKTALIFGAGKTGRGFIGHLCSKSKREIVFVDNDKALITRLKHQRIYRINILKEQKETIEIEPKDYFDIEDLSWLNEFVSAEVCFTAVFGNNLGKLAVFLAKGIEYRAEKGIKAEMNIITCENLSDAALILKNHVINNILHAGAKEYLDTKVGFVEGIVLKTCLSDPECPLDILVQNLYDLPCDQDNFKGSIPDIYGLKPLTNFQNQLIRKIYTYNCINAVMTYLGAEKGCKYLYEATRYPRINKIAEQAGEEASKALIAEFGFEIEEQKTWVQNALNKFADPGIPDPITRNGADPVRKLGREDRLIGPANLALKHNIVPTAILQGILSALKYEDKDNSMPSEISSHGIDWVLQNYCGLNPPDQLFQLIKGNFPD
jgi:mannitol-1-phosphate 5-dehydrogenase